MRMWRKFTVRRFKKMTKKIASKKELEEQTDVSFFDGPVNKLVGAPPTQNSVLDLVRAQNEMLAKTRIQAGDIANHGGSKISFGADYTGGDNAAIWNATGPHDESGEVIEDTYRHKILANRKKSKVAKFEKRQTEIVEVTLDDDDLVPRHMTRKDFFRLYRALSYANSKGVILDIHVTIVWKLLGHEDQVSIGTMLNRGLIKPFTEWCRDNDIDCAYIYANEYSTDAGLHTHFLTSIDYYYLKAFRSWIGNRAVAISKVSPVDKKAIYVAPPPSRSTEKATFKQWTLFQYLCKGADPYANIKPRSRKRSVLVSDLIRSHYESPGEVQSKKRYGVSASIDAKPSSDTKTAFKKKKLIIFDSLLDRGVYSVVELYTDKEYENYMEGRSRMSIEAYSAKRRLSV